MQCDNFQTGAAGVPLRPANNVCSRARKDYYTFTDFKQLEEEAPTIETIRFMYYDLEEIEARTWVAIYVGFYSELCSLLSYYGENIQSVVCSV